MRKKRTLFRVISLFGDNVNYTGIIRNAMYLVFLAVILASCAKEETGVSTLPDPLKAAGIVKIFPSNQADSVAVNPVIAVTFKPGTDAAVISASTLTLKHGSISVPGTVSTTGTTSTFSSETDLTANSEYVATVTTSSREYSWRFRTGGHHRSSLSVVSVSPLNGASSVMVSAIPVVTFNKDLTYSMKSSISMILKAGTTSVSGTLSFSGNKASFKPAVSLDPNVLYSCKVLFSSGSNSNDDDDDDEDDDDYNSGSSYSWSFTTGGSGADVTAPTIASVVPANNATSVAITAKAIVTFSEAMSSASISSSTFTVKQGTTAVAGLVTYSGNAATFTPAAALSAGTVYTGTITTGAKDAAGNALAANYIWSFTTAAASGDVTPPTVSAVIPAANAVSVASSVKATVAFSEAMDASTLTAATFTMKQGANAVAGAVLCSGTTATFTPSAALAANTVYTCTVTTGAKDAAGNALAANYTWSFTTAAAADVTAPTVLSVTPANNATSVAIASRPTITFSESMDAATVTSATFTLKMGTIAVAGSVTLSGNTATFIPSASLVPNTVYSGTITSGAKDAAGNGLAANYTWSFTTAAAADVTAPTVSSVSPLNNATSVAVSSKATVTFSEAMSSVSITSATFTLKQGATSVAGTVTYTGNTATFSPSAALSGNTVYTATVTTGVKDAAGNALAANYTWSFTTAVPADVTAPTVSSVSPLNNATSVAVASKATVTFSEAMSSASITSATFTLKQGTTSVAGTVTYTGNTATFTPSAALTGNTVYTATVTTGVKDAAGNAMAAAYTWSFTTIATAPAGLSFSRDIVPVLGMCNNCHTHNWTVSSNASTFYTNLVSAGYVNPTSPTSSKIYNKLSGGHPGTSSNPSPAQVQSVLTWMNQGSLNN